MQPRGHPPVIPTKASPQVRFNFTKTSRALVWAPFIGFIFWPWVVALFALPSGSQQGLCDTPSKNGPVVLAPAIAVILLYGVLGLLQEHGIIIYQTDCDIFVGEGVVALCIVFFTCVLFLFEGICKGKAK